MKMEEDKMEKPVDGIRLESVAPFEDAMLPLNKGYYICGGIGLAVGLMGGVGIAVLAGLVGAFLWWVIKANIALVKWRQLKAYKFHLSRQVSYEELIAKLVTVLTSYGLRVDRRSDGSPEVSYKNVRMQVKYNGDGTFSMPWRQKLGMLFFDSRYITSYKNTVMAMSILGYHVQQICSGKQEQVIGNGNQTQPITSGRGCSNCGEILFDGAKFCPGCGNSVPVEENNSFCTKCGNAYQKGVKFCRNCGEKLGETDIPEPSKTIS